MSPWDAFLQAIIESPEDITYRLMASDWLEERGEQLERAEFIRVQCDLSDMEADTPENCRPRWAELSRRERELLGKYQGTWTIQMLNHLPDIPRSPLLQITARDATRVGSWPSDDAMFRFRRGFVERVACTMQCWLDHGPALVQVAPLLEVRLTDREPESPLITEFIGKFCWWNSFLHQDHFESGDDDCLPTPLHVGPPGEWTPYNTAELAHAALSRQCLAWARGQAGLPSL